MKAIAVCSGGLDSTVMLYDMIYRGIEPIVLSFDYGQRHDIELEFIEKTAKKLKVPWILTKFPHIGGSALAKDSKDPIPKANYDDESQKITVSPNRNMIMLSLAGGFAVREKCQEVWYAAHGGDHAIYPDCRPEFVQKVSEALLEATYERIPVVAPYLHLNKSTIVRRGSVLSVPFDETWSCYDPQLKSVTYATNADKAYHQWYVHCGECGTCRERKEAFQLAGIRDPTEYVGG